jgi:hypothetical protein
MVYSVLELQSAKHYPFEVIRSLSRDGLLRGNTAERIA